MVLDLPVYWHLPKSSLSLWFFTLHSSISSLQSCTALANPSSGFLRPWFPTFSSDGFLLLTYCAICTTDKTHLLLLKHQLYLLSKSYFLSFAQVIRLQALQVYSEALASKQLHGCFFYLKKNKERKKTSLQAIALFFYSSLKKNISCPHFRVLLSHSPVLSESHLNQDFIPSTLLKQLLSS